MTIVQKFTTTNAPKKTRDRRKEKKRSTKSRVEFNFFVLKKAIVKIPTSRIRRKSKKDKNIREWKGGKLIGSLKNTPSFLENVKLEDFLREQAYGNPDSESSLGTR